jgi:hypothetical protein
MPTHSIAQGIEIWPLSRFIPYARNPRKNDHAVDRMAASIREFTFKVPVLARSSGDVVDGHLRLKAAEKLGLAEIPMILCDGWSEAQVKAFRLLVNRSVTWADWEPELLSLEMLDLRNLDYTLDLTGFDTQEIDELLLADAESRHEDDAPAAPENPASRVGDLWLRGSHRILCGDSTSPEAVARLLGNRKPRLMIISTTMAAAPSSVRMASHGCCNSSPSCTSGMTRKPAAAPPHYVRLRSNLLMASEARAPDPNRRAQQHCLRDRPDAGLRPGCWQHGVRKACRVART